MRRLLCFVCLAAVFSIKINAQVKIGNNPETVDPATLLELESTDKGFLIPRLTTAQVNAIPDPPTGMIVFNTNLNSITMRQDTGWAVIATLADISGGGPSTSPWEYQGINIFNVNPGYVGIGTSFPTAFLHVESNDGMVLFKGVFGGGSDLVESGDGAKLIWHPKKGAFRAGYLDGFFSSNWNENFIGPGSVAMGHNTSATGTESTAFGYGTIASGLNSSAFGRTSTAAGSFSVAMGNNAQATGNNSVALGTAVSTNSFTGSFAFGDVALGTLNNDAHGQMAMRFSGGYKFYTNSAASVGAQLPTGANAWATLSDFRKKENLAEINHEDFLKKISSMHLTSWNYIGQDARYFRHYGPMAQEFYAAFGRDKFGTIGNDTLINQADFDGVNLIAIQALEKRTSVLIKENKELKNQNLKLEKELEDIKAGVQAENEKLAKRLEQLEVLIGKQQK